MDCEFLCTRGTPVCPVCGEDLLYICMQTLRDPTCQEKPGFAYKEQAYERVSEHRVIKKGWGSETVIANQPGMFCLKRIVVNKGGQSSMHYHMNKYEVFYVERGALLLDLMAPECPGKSNKVTLLPGESHFVYPGVPHKLSAGDERTVVFEASTYDDPADSLRLFPGDSQK